MLETQFNPKQPREVETLVRNQSAVSRFDPISGAWTVYAPFREERPDQFKLTRTETSPTQVDCPFCRGREADTPNSVWVGVPTNVLDSPSNGTANGRLTTERPTGALASYQCIDDPATLADLPSDQWSVRVVPNKFPAIGTERKSNQHQRRSPLFIEQAIHGGHEVIIESPNHHQSLVDLDAADAALVFAAYRDRLKYWSGVNEIQYISVFKNCGGDAGASLAHTHSQLIASSVMPKLVRSVVDRAKQYRAKTGCCLQCDLLRAELKEDTRIIAKSDSLVAYCPFASRMPMSVRITSVNHQDRFEELSDEMIESVARLVKRVAAWIEQVRPGSSYNYLLHTKPPGATDCSDAFHWSLEIFPRLAQFAGFELSSECMINSVMPESAAAEFRACAAAENPRNIL